MFQRIVEFTRTFRERGCNAWALMSHSSCQRGADSYTEDASVRTTTACALDIRLILQLLAAAQ